MDNKKHFVLNCDVCDTRKIKEEDYSCYEKMKINADFLIVSASSKGVLNRLPVTINQDKTIEVADDAELELKCINGSYAITGTTAVREHTLLLVNGSLEIHPGTEEVLGKYERIHVNGSVKCPKSLEGYLAGLTVNGSVQMYPDDCVILDSNFLLDPYFPLRAKEGRKYYAETMVIIRDKTVDLAKLGQKKVQFITRRLIVPEEMVEACLELFDETVDFVVVPAGMALHYGDAVLNERLLEKEGDSIYVYGDLEVEADCDLTALAPSVKRILVKGKVVLRKSQEEGLRKLNMEYDRLEFEWEGRTIKNTQKVRIDKALLEGLPSKVRVKNTTAVKIDADVTPEMILDRLELENCVRVFCKKEQESALAAVSRNVAKIGESEEDSDKEDQSGQGAEALSGLLGGMKNQPFTKVINADHYIM